MTPKGPGQGRRQTPVRHLGDPSEQFKMDQERLAQLETYAADLSRTYSELRRHLQHLTVLHEVNTRIASALDPDEVLASLLDSLNQLVTYETAGVHLLDLDVAVPVQGPHSLVPSTSLPRLRAGRAFDAGPLETEGTLAAEDSPVAEAMRTQQTVGRPTNGRGLRLAVPLRAGGRALGANELQLADPLPDDDVQVI